MVSLYDQKCLDPSEMRLKYMMQVQEYVKSVCNGFLIKASVYFHTSLRVALKSCERLGGNKTISYLGLNQMQIFI